MSNCFQDNLSIITIMDELLQKRQWNKIKELLSENKFLLKDKVDQMNHLIHYLTIYHQTDLIKSAGKDQIINALDVKNHVGNTPAHLAAELHHDDLLELYLDYKPEIIYQVNNLGHSLVYYLMRDDTQLKAAIEKYGITDHYFMPGLTILLAYIRGFDLNMVIWLLEHNFDPNYPPKDPPIISAVILNDNDHEPATESRKIKLEMVEQLINYGAIVDSFNATYHTPLLLAIAQSNYNLVELLLRKGANIKYHGAEGNEHPISLAMALKDVKMIKLLLEYGPDLDAKNKFLETPLHYMYYEGLQSDIHLGLRQKLVEMTNNLNAVSAKRDTIFNLIMQKDNWKQFIHILRQKKLKAFYPNKDGIKPIDSVDSGESDDMKLFENLLVESYIHQLKSNPNVKWEDPFDNQLAELDKINPKFKEFQKKLIKKIRSGQSYPKMLTALDPDEIKVKIVFGPETNLTTYSSYTNNYLSYLCGLMVSHRHLKIPPLPNKFINKLKSSNEKVKEFYHELTEPYRVQPDNFVNKIMRSMIKEYILQTPSFVNHLIIWHNKLKYFISPYLVEGIKETIKSHPDTKLIFMKISIITDKEFNHANALIMDLTNKTIERFDPYGVVPFIKSDELDSTVRKFFSENFPNYAYLTPNDVAKGHIFQVFSDESNPETQVMNDPGGFCMAWILWYTESRLLNPKLDSSSLIQGAISLIVNSGLTFREYIRNYTSYLDQLKNKLMDRAKVPEKYRYSAVIPDEIYHDYIRVIRRILQKIL